MPEKEQRMNKDLLDKFCAIWFNETSFTNLNITVNIILSFSLFLFLCSALHLAVSQFISRVNVFIFTRYSFSNVIHHFNSLIVIYFC